MFIETDKRNTDSKVRNNKHLYGGDLQCDFIFCLKESSGQLCGTSRTIIFIPVLQRRKLKLNERFLIILRMQNLWRNC